MAANELLLNHLLASDSDSSNSIKAILTAINANKAIASGYLPCSIIIHYYFATTFTWCEWERTKVQMCANCGVNQVLEHMTFSFDAFVGQLLKSYGFG